MFLNRYAMVSFVLMSCSIGLSYGAIDPIDEEILNELRQKTPADFFKPNGDQCLAEEGYLEKQSPAKDAADLT